MKAKKFATQIDEETLNELKKYAKESNRSISGVVTEAVAEFLGRARLRPAFKSAMKDIINEHEELLKELAK